MPRINHELALTALGAVLLIPTGLAGMFAGLSGLSRPVGDLQEALDSILLAVEAAAPWCQPMLCLLFGLLALGTAAFLLARGLQSTRSRNQKSSSHVI